MKILKQIKQRFKAVSLFETIISLTLIMLAFVILGQTFVWSNKEQYHKFKQRIEERNVWYDKLME